MALEPGLVDQDRGHHHPGIGEDDDARRNLAGAAIEVSPDDAARLAIEAFLDPAADAYAGQHLIGQNPLLHDPAHIDRAVGTEVEIDAVARIGATVAGEVEKREGDHVLLRPLLGIEGERGIVVGDRVGEVAEVGSRIAPVHEGPGPIYVDALPSPQHFRFEQEPRRLEPERGQPICSPTAGFQTGREVSTCLRDQLPFNSLRVMRPPHGKNFSLTLFGRDDFGNLGRRQAGEAPDEPMPLLPALTCAEPPGEATHWTGRAMAKAVGISLRSVQRIWEAHRLQPHRIRTFKRSNDRAFAEFQNGLLGGWLVEHAATTPA